MRHAAWATAVLFAGCTTVAEQDSLIGSWRSDAASLSLHADGTFQAGKINGCWEREASQLILKWPCLPLVTPKGHPCQYSLAAGVLTLKGCMAQGQYRRVTS